MDYRPLLERVGFVLRPAFPNTASAGRLRFQDVQGRTRITAPVPFGSPAYSAGLEHDDVILAIDGTDVRSAVEVEQAIRRHKPGDELAIVFERRGQRATGRLRLEADPQVEIVSAESAGRSLSAEQRRARDEWLSSAARNVF